MIQIFRAITYMASGGMASTLLKDHIPTLTPKKTQFTLNPKYAAVAGTALVASAWCLKNSSVTAGQFYQACSILQTQVNAVSGALVGLKNTMLERFSVVETKLDALKETTQVINTNVEDVQESLEEVRTRVENIDTNTKFSSSVLGKILKPSVPKAEWWLSV